MESGNWALRAARPEQQVLQMEDLLDIALSALQWSTDTGLSRGERDMAHRLFTLALALAEQEQPPAHDWSMLKAMICHLCRATEKTLCTACPFGYCG